VQAYVRGLLARKQTRSLRQQKAAVNIQTAWRRYKMRQQYNLVLHNITAVQVCRHAVLAMVWGCCSLQSPCRECLCVIMDLQTMPTTYVQTVEFGWSFCSEWELPLPFIRY
jgi:predicted metal-binding protein